MANLQFGVRPNIIQGDNLSVVHSSDSDVFIEYNNFYPAGTNVSAYRIEARLELKNVVVNDDLSVEFDYGGIQAVRAYSRFSTTPVGYSVTKTLYKADGTTAWSSTDDIAASFESGWVSVNPKPTTHYKVPANSSITLPETKAFRWLATALVSDECEVYVGGTVTNVIPTYKPNGIRKSGEWKSIQQLSLSTFIRKGNNWTDVGTEQVETIGQTDKGDTRRRQSGAWKQEGPFS